MIQNEVPSSPTPEAVSKVTQEILSRGEFKHLSDGNSFWDWLDKNLDWPSFSPVLPETLLVILVLALAIFIGFMVVSLLQKGSSFHGHTSPLGRRDATVALEGSAKSFEEALAMANKAYRQKNWHRALWILHRLFLGVLDERGSIRFEKWKTNSDFLAEISPKDPYRGLFILLNQNYEAVVYGHQPMSADLGQLLDRVAASRKVTAP